MRETLSVELIQLVSLHGLNPHNYYFKQTNKQKIGYLRITDFGIARVWRPDNAADTSGTPGYMGKKHCKSVYEDLLVY